ncbi:hypothetical protein B0I32_117228 [Nonomuraea fuscirosea]|uniref:Uncharacterized protein n=1 Tax=Nonomuraea fuscirosea TaxID=1291556 RepID=A0A2T0MQP2_9ACTN|nr:hypothetical protein B0I32_117228 [Nonomuraea fuscirosea]
MVAAALDPLVRIAPHDPDERHSRSSSCCAVAGRRQDRVRSDVRGESGAQQRDHDASGVCAAAWAGYCISSVCGCSALPGRGRTAGCSRGRSGPRPGYSGRGSRSRWTMRRRVGPGPRGRVRGRGGKRRQVISREWPAPDAGHPSCPRAAVVTGVRSRGGGRGGRVSVVSIHQRTARHPEARRDGFAPSRRACQTVRSASVGCMRAARMAGSSPAVAPMATAAPSPPAQVSGGITVAQLLMWV